MWHYLRAQPAASDWGERHDASPGDRSFHYTAASIDEYLAAARRHVIQGRTDLDGRQDDWTIDGNCPFVLEPATPGRPRNAILMAHGLTESPFAMRDMARFFQQQGFYVLAMQLPGHGTRPGDLLDVSWRDWVRAHQHLLGLLRYKADNIYAFGFSAGATLSLYQALLNPTIKGLFLFSPALRITPLARVLGLLASQGQRWRRLAWLDIQPDTDPFKYESLSNRAIAQAYAMIRTVHHLISIGERNTPLFAAVSARDATVSAHAALSWFGRQTGPRRLLYYTSGRPRVPAQVQRCPDRFPEQGIQSFAHTSLIQSPANPHYGAHGSQRVCAHYYRLNPDSYQRCKAGQEDCLGEIFAETDACRVIRRLTYNPSFEAMLGELQDFMRTAGITTGAPD